MPGFSNETGAEQDVHKSPDAPPPPKSVPAPLYGPKSKKPVGKGRKSRRQSRKQARRRATRRRR